MTITEPINLRDFPPVEDNIERPDTLSQTLLGKHDDCPRSAYLSRKYETASIAMDRGTAFHLVAEEATNTMLEQGEPTMPGDAVKGIADGVMAEHPELVLPAESQDAVRLMAWNWAEGTVLDLDAIIGVELPIRFELGGFTLTCRIDRAEVYGSSLHLYDYKTSLNVRKREDVQRGFQGQFYALAALRGEVVQEGVEPFSIGSGIEDVWFWEVYPRYRDEDSGALIAKDGSWDKLELHEFATSLARNIESFEASLESGDWPARDDPSWCGGCPAPAECPIPEHLRAVPEITTPEQAVDAFSLRLANEREGRRLQAALRGWVKEHGPIFLSEHAFDAQFQQSKEVVNWDGLLRAIYQSAEFGQPLRLDDHIRVKESTRFSKRKLTEEERDAS